MHLLMPCDLSRGASPDCQYCSLESCELCENLAPPPHSTPPRGVLALAHCPHTLRHVTQLCSAQARVLCASHAPSPARASLVSLSAVLHSRPADLTPPQHSARDLTPLPLRCLAVDGGGSSLRLSWWRGRACVLSRGADAVCMHVGPPLAGGPCCFGFLRCCCTQRCAPTPPPCRGRFVCKNNTTHAEAAHPPRCLSLLAARWCCWLSPRMCLPPTDAQAQGTACRMPCGVLLSSACGCLILM